MIVAIKASKMFNSSTRKQKILSAIQDPINVELVQQLDKYIPDVFPKETELDLNKGKEHSKNTDSTSSEHKSSSHRSPSVSHSSGSPMNFHSAEVGNSSEVENDSQSVEDGDTSSSQPSDDSAIEDVTPNSSSAIHRKQVKGHKQYDIMLGDVQVLLGTLNSRDDTAGVTRVTIETNESSSSKELWIYYEDSVNLNNVMTLVIDLVSRSYSQFVFNRLARSNNAIVFDVGQPTAISAVAQH